MMKKNENFETLFLNVHFINFLSIHSSSEDSNIHII